MTMWIVCMLLSKQVVKVLQIPPPLYMPIIGVPCIIGSYSLGINVFNVYRILSVGIVSYFLIEMRYPIAPLIIGVILVTKASIIYYGRFNPKDDLSKMRAKILGHFGTEDRGIKVDTVHEFQAKLKTTGGDHEIYIYENAGHAFANEGGSRYNKEPADLAWKRTAAFLTKNL